jgi:hypothetical protein
VGGDKTNPAVGYFFIASEPGVSGGSEPGNIGPFDGLPPPHFTINNC